MMEPLVIVCKDRAEWLEARRDGLGAVSYTHLAGCSLQSELGWLLGICSTSRYCLPLLTTIVVRVWPRT